MSGLKLAKGKTVTLKSQIYAPGTGKQEEPGMDRYIDTCPSHALHTVSIRMTVSFAQNWISVKIRAQSPLGKKTFQ